MANTFLFGCCLPKTFFVCQTLSLFAKHIFVWQTLHFVWQTINYLPNCLTFSNYLANFKPYPYYLANSMQFFSVVQRDGNAHLHLRLGLVRRTEPRRAPPWRAVLRRAARSCWESDWQGAGMHTARCSVLPCAVVDGGRYVLSVGRPRARWSRSVESSRDLKFA